MTSRSSTFSSRVFHGAELRVEAGRRIPERRRRDAGIEERVGLFALRVDARFGEAAEMQIGGIERQQLFGQRRLVDSSSLRKISSQ